MLLTSPAHVLAQTPATGRRRFLASMACVLATGVVGPRAWCGPPANRTPPGNPRATDGDSRHEPDWERRLTVTVGPDKADLVGKDDRVLQAAVQYVKRLGGGTVQILPGTYTCRNSVFLPSGVRLLGSGQDSIITKIASETVALTEDSDWYDQEITVGNSKSFRVGDGIVLQAKNPHNGSQEVIKRTLIARSGNRFKLDAGLRKNLWLSGKPTASSLFPLLTSERTSDVFIENLTLDGNIANNANLNGNYGGCIFLQDCQRYTIRGVTARRYNGDGISFQICHDVRVEDCHSHDNQGLGLHPGSGSQRPVMLNNRLRGNTIGLFWCWGVKFGLAEGNTIEDNRNYGISIGHNDTDNVMRNNKVLRSGKVGVLFRDDTRGKDFWANRNVLEGNLIADSGDEQGIAIDITGRTRQIVISGNTIQESRAAAKRIGIRIGNATRQIDLKDNKISGVMRPVHDMRA